MNIVLYHPDSNEIGLWRQIIDGDWGADTIGWYSIELCIEHGWEVIGVL